MIYVENDRDISRVRRAVSRHSERLEFSELNRTRLVTASSELCRNMLTYGGGGEVLLEELKTDLKVGLQVSFVDQGPGIMDQENALKDGYSTGKGLGLGLGGARRLVDEFRLDTESGKGTTVSVVSWQ